MRFFKKRFLYIFMHDGGGSFACKFTISHYHPFFNGKKAIQEAIDYAKKETGKQCILFNIIEIEKGLNL